MKDFQMEFEELEKTLSKIENNFPQEDTFKKLQKIEKNFQVLKKDFFSWLDCQLNESLEDEKQP